MSRKSLTAQAMKRNSPFAAGPRFGGPKQGRPTGLVQIPGNLGSVPLPKRRAKAVQLAQAKRVGQAAIGGRGGGSGEGRRYLRAMRPGGPFHRPKKLL